MDNGWPYLHGAQDSCCCCSLAHPLAVEQSFHLDARMGSLAVLELQAEVQAA